MNKAQKIEVKDPINQINLHGFNDYFLQFISLYKKNALPNIILLSGEKGIGKATFAYHFINYLLSQNEDHSYSIESFKINPKNFSYDLVKNSIHPNFFLLDSKSLGENIKIDQTRSLIKFLNQTNYSNNLKLVLLDNADLLNVNSSNSLLKALEEPSSNTFFFIIDNNSSDLLDTIKSRSLKFNFYFTLSEKRNIFNKIIGDYNLKFTDQNINDFFYFDSHGNFLRYLTLLKDSNLDISSDDLSCINYLMEKYRNSRDNNLLNFISLFIEKYYNKLSLSNFENVNKYFIDKNKIIYLISDMKKFNLDKKNLLISMDRILNSER